MSNELHVHEDVDETASAVASFRATVTVNGPGISIERHVDEELMSGVIAMLFGAPVTPASDGIFGALRDGGVRKPQPWGDEPTLGEFIDETGASTFAHKICAAGYFLVNNRGQESFTRDDVKNALIDAQEDMPGNFARDWRSAASSNLIAQKPGESGKFIVPRTGRTAVESCFQDLPKRRARRSVKKREHTTENGE
ncbi:MAG: hypothetical protein E7Z95_01520 [Actinomyces succiniciruminis]|nr:hypothetical protein [Actinomyces succiniciruminis]